MSPGAENRRRKPALPAPFLALGVQQSPADRLAEYVVIERLLGKALGPVQQNRLDRLGVHNEYRLDTEPAVMHDRFIVEILGPAGDRVAEQPPQQARKGQPPLGRGRPLDNGVQVVVPPAQ